MLYESLGDLLCEAANTLHRDVRAAVGDERVRTQLDAMVALAHDVGRMWPALFAGIEEENRILERALHRQGPDTPRTTRPAAAVPRVERAAPDAERADDAAAADVSPVDALTRHRELTRRLGDRIDRLHAAGTPAARAELDRLRQAMWDAAQVQQRVVDSAAASGPGAVRRI